MSCDVEIDFQVACTATPVPPAELFRGAAACALEDLRDCAQLTLRFVDRAESRELNERFRGRQNPTNVLSFPDAGHAEIAPDYIGDVVICVPLAVDEARAATRDLTAHLLHLAVHGVLHLVGHDHENDEDAERMEALERSVLATLGYPDPYAD